MFRDKIEALCKQRGITISRLEKDSGLAHATILKWDKSSPTLASLKKVADTLEIPLSELTEHYDG